jgi:hypothetical protein
LRAIERCVQPCPIFIVKVVPLIHGHEVNHRAFWQIYRFVEHQVPVLHRCSQCVCHAQRLPHDKGQRAKRRRALARRASSSTLIAETLAEEIACWAVTTIRWTLTVDG